MRFSWKREPSGVSQSLPYLDCSHSIVYIKKPQNLSHNRWGIYRIVLALTNGQQEYLNLQINFKGDIASPTKYLKDNLYKSITLSTAKPAAILSSHYAMKSRLCFNDQILVCEK